jgi:hypothetical protein
MSACFVARFRRCTQSSPTCSCLYCKDWYCDRTPLHWRCTSLRIWKARDCIWHRMNEDNTMSTAILSPTFPSCAEICTLLSYDLRTSLLAAKLSVCHRLWPVDYSFYKRSFFFVGSSIEGELMLVINVAYLLRPDPQAEKSWMQLRLLECMLRVPFVLCVLTCLTKTQSAMIIGTWSWTRPANCAPLRD